MPTVTIGSTEYEVYQETADVDDYLAAALNTDEWDALSSAEKNRTNVAMTRLLDRQRWQGAKASSGQALAFPRSGLTDSEGNAVSSESIPAAVLSAHSELCLIAADGSTVQADATTENTIKRVKAGSAEVENFRNAGGSPTRFPLVVHELIGRWLAGAGVSLAGIATGTDATSALDDGYKFTGGV